MCFHRRRIPKHLLLQPSVSPISYGRLVKWFLIFVLAVVLTVIAAVARAVPHEPELSGRTQSHQRLSPDQVSAGTLLFKNQGQGFSAALHHDSEARVTIKGMLAKVVLRQRFENTSDEWVEGVYVFPLGETAAVSRMVMEVGDRRLVAQIKEKAEAQRIYQEAKNDGRRAALTEQERPNLFTQSIANIAPGEVVTIELHFHEAVSFSDNTFRWRLPTTLTPRYIPGTPLADDTQRALSINGWALPTDQVPDADRISPFVIDPPRASGSEKITNPIRIHLRLDAGLPLANIRGSYHQLRLHKTGEIHRIVTTPELIPMDRDFEITWQTPAGKTPDAALFVEEIDGDDYALLMVLPPQQQLAQTLPREVVFIIDTSGSMGGTSIAQAQASLLLALSRLQPQDRFNVIEFNSDYQPLFSSARYAGVDELQRAKKFVQQLRAQGGTEMRGALQEALKDAAPEGYLKQVVFMTDGSVGNEAELFKLIHEQLGDARLFTVGIGSAPNSYFMRKAAEFGRGTFTYVGSENELAEKMQELFGKLESPVLSNLQIQWPGGINGEAWPQRIPDLYQGEPLMVSVKIDGKLPPHSEIVISGQQAAHNWSRRIKVQSSADQKVQAGVAVRWARSKIEALLDDKTRGRHEDEVRADVLQLALQHQLLSPYTSFVAAEEFVSRPPHAPLAAAAVPNLLPSGQTLRTVSYPQTATSAPLQLLLGMMAFFGLLWLRHCARQNRDKHE
jgi:Ca-activated chloride channel family protein